MPLGRRSAIARTNLGSAYFERGDEDAALHWFRDAQRLSVLNMMRVLGAMTQRSLGDNSCIRIKLCD